MAIMQAHKNMIIVGMGLTGLSCAHYFSRKGISFRIVDSRENPPLKEKLLAELPNVDYQCGEFSEHSFSSSDCLIVSPGISLDNNHIKKALEDGALLSSDIALFVENNHQPIIGITGSNGKSTVTTLVGELLENAGKKVCVAGNIGTPILDALVTDQLFDVFVLELSSFQLERLEKLNAFSVTILNLSEDHLDRYISIKNYLAAKQKILIGAKYVVINRDDIATVSEVNIQSEVISFGFSSPAINEFGITIVDGKEWIAYEDKPIIACEKLLIRGRHNVANVMAALALIKHFNIDEDSLVKTLSEFKGLRHRCEWVGTVKGIDFYNDSKATNVGAALAAISGFDIGNGNLLLIAGGKDKESDFSELAIIVREKIKKVFLIGIDAPKLKQAFGDDLCIDCASLDEAVKKAYQFSKPADVVLLAPACASFDMFDNYQQRGDIFCHAVGELSLQ